MALERRRRQCLILTRWLHCRFAVSTLLAPGLALCSPLLSTFAFVMSDSLLEAPYLLQEQHVPEHSLMDSFVTWMLLNPTEVSTHAIREGWKPASAFVS